MRATLEQGPAGRVEIDHCTRCHGVWFDSGELATLTAIGNREAFDLQSPLLAGDRESEPCPRHPDTRMLQRQLLPSRLRGMGAVEADQSPLHVDQCPQCSGLWFDGGELDRLMTSLRDSRMAPFLIDPAAMDRPSSSWRWLFMLLTGLPVEQWQPRLRRPLAVLTLIALCFLVFAWQLTDPSGELWAHSHALLPMRLFQRGLQPLLTHMFMHGSVVHLLGNLYFLWVFGDNVEDRLGSTRFLLLYLAAGLGAALCHCLLTSRPDLPVLGASGAVAGVMAAYVVLFPQARLVSMIFLFTIRWKTSTYLLIWLGYQFIGAAMGVPGIAWWAHIGGFAIGWLIARPYRLGVAPDAGPAINPWPAPSLPPYTGDTSAQDKKASGRKLEWY